MFTRKLSFTKPTYPKAIAMGITEFPYIEHNSDGYITYWEDSDGSWTISERDSNGQEIYGENSDGYWCKYEYDSNGYVIYFEDSNGIIKKF